MKRRLCLIALIASSAAVARPGPLPHGAIVEASGFATIETVPPSPWPERPASLGRPPAGGHDESPSPPVFAALRPLIRIFPQSDRPLGVTNQALLGGRLELRDGCFYVTRPGRPDRLAYFAREVGLGIDGQGYLALLGRGSAPRPLGRIGEELSWAGPIAAPETLPMVAELRARCGAAPLEHVGVPRSARLFRVRPWVIDAIAERRGIPRDEAWRRFRTCLEAQEAKAAGAPLDCDTL